MKIVTRKELMQAKQGTLFSDYTPHAFGELLIKDKSSETDFYYSDITQAVDCDSSNEYMEIMDNAYENRTSFSMDFDSIDRDGLYDHDQLYVIWEKEDVEKLIERLNRALLEGYL